MINEKILLEFVDSKGGFGCMTRENWLELENLQKADGERAIARADEAGKGEKEKEVLWAATRKAKAIQTEARLKEADEREVEKEAAWQVQREAERVDRESREFHAQDPVERQRKSLEAHQERQRQYHEEWKRRHTPEPSEHWLIFSIKYIMILAAISGFFIILATTAPILGIIFAIIFQIGLLTTNGTDHSNNSNGQ